MGIKGLWGILTPFCEKKSLHEIRGETLAVDLSGWICDSQNVTDYYIQPKLYLRNLFFRTVYLLLADINPIFVLEGDAPELKRDVMAARNAIQFRGAPPKSDNVSNKKPDVARKRFHGVLRECELLLKCMGVSCIKGYGEAEATCAQLNSSGLVDAVVSQDSDCFAYGAKRVYRNFSVSSSAGGGAMQGSVDLYDADKLFRENGFGRNKMVALALLCGCDYGAGACGSSITTAVAYLHTLTEEQVLPRLLSWISDPAYFDEQARWLNVAGRCDRCGHGGRTHGSRGCPVCVTDKGCHDTGHKAKISEVKRELSLRSRAITCGFPFPQPVIMKEFLKQPPLEQNCLDTFKTPTPSLIEFVKIMKKKLDWTERYCVEKFLPLLTKLHLQDAVPCRTIQPIRINKKRNPRGVPSYEVIWSDIDGQYGGLIPDDQIKEDEDHSTPWTTVERQDLMSRYYSDLVEQYEESVKKPVKEKKPRGRKKKDTDNNEKPKRKYTKKIKEIVDEDIQNLSNSLTRLNISKNDLNKSKSKFNISLKIKTLKRKHKPLHNQKTIDSFIKNKRRKSKICESNELRFSNIKCDTDEVFDIVSKDNNKENDLMYNNVANYVNDKPNRKRLTNMFNLSQDEINESDLSLIVDKIVTNAPTVTTTKLNNNMVKLIFGQKCSTPRKSLAHNALKDVNNCSTPKDSPNKSMNYSDVKICDSPLPKLNTSHFFDKLTEDGDAFELSCYYNYDVINVSDHDRTEQYSYNDVI